MAVAALTFALLALAPRPVRGQVTDKIYSPVELTEAPRVAVPADAARLIQESYPRRLLDAGVEGSVQLSLIVGSDGQVESDSIEVLSASVDALASVASGVARRIRFSPGKVDGQPVRVRVVLPLVYKAR
jgi:protein TonB